MLTAFDVIHAVALLYKRKRKGVRGNLAECTSGVGRHVTVGRLATGPINESDSQRVWGRSDREIPC